MGGKPVVPAGARQIRSYVPEAVAERLTHLSKALNVSVSELSADCIVNGIDQAAEERIQELEATLASLRRAQSGNVTQAPNPLPVRRKGRAEKEAEVRKEREAEEQRRARDHAARRRAGSGKTEVDGAGW